MSIVYNKGKKTFSLHTARTTYQLKIGNLNYVNHLYYGATIRDEDLDYLIRRYDRGFSGNPYDSLKERTFSLDALQPGVERAVAPVAVVGALRMRQHPVRHLHSSIFSSCH